MLSPTPCEQFPCTFLLLSVSLYPFLFYPFIFYVLHPYIIIFSYCVLWNVHLSVIDGDGCPHHSPHNSPLTDKSRSYWRWLDSLLSQCAEFTECPGWPVWGDMDMGMLVGGGFGLFWFWPNLCSAIGQGPHILIPIGRRQSFCAMLRLGVDIKIYFPENTKLNCLSNGCSGFK